MSKLQTHYPFNQISQSWTSIQEASGSSATPNAGRTISCKALNSHVEYPCKNYDVVPEYLLTTKVFKLVCGMQLTYFWKEISFIFSYATWPSFDSDKN